MFRQGRRFPFYKEYVQSAGESPHWIVNIYLSRCGTGNLLDRGRGMAAMGRPFQGIELRPMAAKSLPHAQLSRMSSLDPLARPFAQHKLHIYIDSEASTSRR
jgi:hypothetical protein